MCVSCPQNDGILAASSSPRIHSFIIQQACLACENFAEDMIIVIAKQVSKLMTKPNKSQMGRRRRRRRSIVSI